MESPGTLISGIEYKVRKLIGLVARLQNENRELKERIEEYKNKSINLELRIDQQQEKIRILKLAKSLSKEESKTEVKLKINELLREIDNCVRLLNK
jgi:predicted RNase H-like nuclease (RuvC/YqgF family)